LRASKQLAWIITLASLGTAAAAAQAANELCPGEASSVTMTPRWWTQDGTPPTWGTQPRRDPGWTGAAQAAFGVGAGTRGIFRAVYGTNTHVNPTGPVLYLSWQMDMNWIGTDTCGNPNARIFFAVAPGADTDQTHAKVFRLEFHNRANTTSASGAALICDSRTGAVGADPYSCHNPLPNCSPGHDDAGNASYAIYNWVGGAAPGIQVNNAAIEESHYLNDFGRIWVDPAGPWTVNLAIPVGAGSGISQGNDLKIYFEVRNCEASGCITEQWPRRDPFETHSIQQPSMATLTLPAMNQWGSMRLPPAGGPACSHGVSLDPDDIGLIVDPPMSGAIADTSNPAAYTFDFFGAKLQTEIVGLSGGVPARNVFVARPLNGTGLTVAQDKIAATFRLADWGSLAEIGTGGGWIDIPGEPEPPPPANEIKNYTSIPSGNKGTIVYQWKLTEAERCTYGLETSPPDGGPPCGSKLKDNQVLLVQLKGHAGANIDFVDDSVYRSMRFINASRFSDEAQINLEGLPPASGPRTIYIAAKQSQMSIVQGEPRVPSIDVYQRLDSYLEEAQNVPGTLGGAQLERLNSIRARLHESLGDSPEGLLGQPGRQKALYELMREAPTEALKEIMPTVEYQVFREGDVDMVEGDQHYKVLEPMTSFGYFVQHVSSPDLGDNIYGWVHTLRGPVEKVAPGIYKMTIPAGQTKAVIETRVQALERADEPPDTDENTGDGGCNDCPACPGCPPCPPLPSCAWWKWLAAILLALGIGIAIGKKL
jgi:hypothetical protein